MRRVASAPAAYAPLNDFFSLELLSAEARDAIADRRSVLLYPGTKLRVVDTMNMGGGLFQVHLKEVAMPVQLIK